MITKFLENLISKARPETLNVKTHGVYVAEVQQATYNDGKGQYEVLQAFAKNRSVSNLNSLISAVKEECKRREGQQDGKYMTVGFTLLGGYFFCNDNMPNLGFYEYKRQKSALWKVIERIIDREFDHKELIVLIQNLRLAFKSPEEFNKVFSGISELKVKKGTEATSKPIATGGKFGNSYKEEFDIGGFACTLTVEVPYLKGSEEKYDIDLWINIITNGEHTYFKIICPEFEMVEEEAILNEISDFRKEVAELKELLILEDY